MREVFDIRCGRVPERVLVPAAGGGGLLTPGQQRLSELVSSGSIHDVYDVEHVPFAR